MKTFLLTLITFFIFVSLSFSVEIKLLEYKYYMRDGEVIHVDIFENDKKIKTVVAGKKDFDDVYLKKVMKSYTINYIEVSRLLVKEFIGKKVIVEKDNEITEYDFKNMDVEDVIEVIEAFIKSGYKLNIKEKQDAQESSL